jgi:hypothetical protein
VPEVSKVVKDMFMVDQFEVGGAFVSFVCISIVVALMNSKKHPSEFFIIVVF